MRRLDHSAIARDIGHRRESIHLLRSRDTRHAVHGEHRELPCGHLLHQLRVLRRPNEADDRGAGAHRRHLGTGRSANFEDEIGLRKKRLGVTRDRGPGSDIGVVRKVGERASARFDRDRKAQFAPFLDDIRDGGDALFAGVNLTRNTDGQRHGNLRVAAGRADDTTFTFLSLNLVAGLPIFRHR